jgi:RNA polymerase sigma-54 factor
MELSPKLLARTEQKQIMTHALQQSLEILQLPQIELGALIQEEIEKNPLLELDSTPFSKRSAATSTTFPDVEAKPSLYEHLLKQINDAFATLEAREIALELLERLNDKGMIEEVAVSEETVLSDLQTFDPPGIFARSIQESFLIQLERSMQKKSLAYQIVHLCYDDLLNGRYKKMEKTLRTTGEELRKAIKKLANLSTRPAAQFETVVNKPIFPDLRIVKAGKKWSIMAMEDALPTFHMNEDYLHIASLPKEEKSIMKGFVASGNWLQKSIERRRELLLSIGAHLAKNQTAYLDQTGPLVPMCPEELASLFGVHESTISRALADKYVESPRGLIPLRELISTHGNESAKQLLQKLIAHENKLNPLTDDQLAEELQKSGHQVARRTVAKYRKQFKISPATSRKTV